MTGTHSPRRDQPQVTTDMVHVAEDPFLKSNQKAKAAPTCQAWGALPHSSAQEGTCRPQRGLRLVQHSSRLPGLE